MKDVLKYKDFWGSVEVNISDGVIHGKILHINDLVTYEAKTVDQIEEEFKAAVDDYLETCEQVGKAPNKPFSGTFNIRIGPERHQELGAFSTLTGNSINETIKVAIDDFLKNKEKKHIVQKHVYIIGNRDHWSMNTDVEHQVLNCNQQGDHYEIALLHSGASNQVA